MFAGGNRPGRRTIKRYVLFQLPGLAGLIILLVMVEKWVGLPGWAIWSVLAGWIAKDVILFPFVWRSYTTPPPVGDRMIGQTGTCRERLSPSGYVFIRGELWKAELKRGSRTRPIEKGETVVVVGMQGLRLIVLPKEEGSVDEVNELDSGSGPE